MLHVAVVDIRAREGITGILERLLGNERNGFGEDPREAPPQGKQKIAAAVLYLGTPHTTATHL
jgi:hypothetical protein